MEVAEHAESRRRDWVTKRLVHYGRARARTLGWPDIYTLTKALGERAVEETAGDLSLSIVRPVDHRIGLHPPAPRVDRGLQDGRADHPGVRPRGVPGVPRHPRGHPRRDPGRLRGERAARGRRPPHRARRPRLPPRLQRRTQPAARSARSTTTSASTSASDPLPDRGRGFVKTPTWEFPGQRRVERQLRTGEKAIAIADRWVTPPAALAADPRAGRDSSTGPRAGSTSSGGTRTCTARTSRPRSSTPTTGRSTCSGRCPRPTSRSSRSTRPTWTGGTTCRTSTARR